MSNVELTLDNLLQGLAGEIRSPSGPGYLTREFNEALITEYRRTGGQLVGEIDGSSLILMTTTGAKSGNRRVTPLAFVEVEGRMLIIASKGGAPTSPAWYFNIKANPAVTVEHGSETYEADAVIIDGPERDRLFAEIAAQSTTFAGYQQRTERKIPIAEIRRR